jgi:hypothetical protein
LKVILFGLLFFLAANVSAKTLRCEVVDTVYPPTWPKKVISIQVEAAVISIDYIHKIPNPDGTFKDKIETIYGGLNRGGYKVNYCNPNDNEYNASTGKISIFSECIYGSGDKLFFDAELSASTSGYIEITLLPFGSDLVERKIPVSACK